MDPEENWKETDTHVRTFLSSQPNKTKNKKFDAVPVLNKLKEIIQEPGSQYWWSLLSPYTDSENLNRFIHQLQSSDTLGINNVDNNENDDIVLFQ